ncbi:hypothetical protein Tco_1293735 [Tanacetum coccineum]
MHINFLENKPNVAGKGPNWLFDLDYLTDSMNYHSVRSENQANPHAGQKESNQNAGTKDKFDAGNSEQEDESAQDCFELPIWHSYSSPTPKSDDKRGAPREEEQVFLDDLARLERQEKEASEEAEALRKQFAQESENLATQTGAAKSSGTNIFSTVSTTAKASGTNFVNTVGIPVSTASPNEGLSLSEATNSQEDDSEIPQHEGIYQDTTDGIFTNSSYDDEGAAADFTNLETVVNVSPIPTSRIHSTHPKELILGDPTSTVQTRSKLNKSSGSHAFVSYIQKQRRNNHKDFHHCLFACFLSQHEPMKILEALEDESWVDAMQEELLQFEIQKVWILVDLPYGKKAIGTKWVYRNRKDERGVVFRNKASLRLDLVLGHVQRLYPSEEIHNRRLSISWQETHFLAMQEADHCDTSNYRIKILMLLQAAVGQVFVDSKSNVRPMVPIMNTKDRHDYESYQMHCKEPKGKHFLGKVTPLFATMLVQPTQDEGASLERPSEALHLPSPAPTSEIPHDPQTDSSLAQTSEVPFEHQTDQSPRPSPTTTILDSIPETSENAQNEERTREMVDEDKEIDENILSTGRCSSQHRSSQAVSREKEKGVELKDIEETDRPRPTSTRSLLTLKPLPKIDPKDKGKKKIGIRMNLKVKSNVSEARVKNSNILKQMKRWLGKFKKSGKVKRKETE